MALEFIDATGTTGVAVSPHVVVSSPKYSSPQFTVMSVVDSTSFSAVVTWYHFDAVPQLASKPMAPVHVMSSLLFSIDSDRSCTIKMSGGCFIAEWVIAPQFMSTDVPTESDENLDPSSGLGRSMLMSGCWSGSVLGSLSLVLLWVLLVAL